MITRRELERFSDEINVQADYDVQLEAWGIDKAALFEMVVENITPEVNKISSGETVGQDLVVSLLTCVFTGIEIGYRCAMHNEMERMKGGDN